MLHNNQFDDATVVQYLDNILEQAVAQKASDIHFEPYEHHYRIRFRQDGILYEKNTPPSYLSKQLCARIKILARLDIAEKRLPQDGGFRLAILNQQVMDFRVSTCPTLYGEKIVLRLLDSSFSQLTINELGFEDTQKEIFLDAIHQSQGMILVTGPTGSGKTVTLYSALSLLNTQELNIMSVEDPVEIKCPGINQVNVNSKIGLTFSNTLRTFLRQDPDIIMLGEIRDLETADMAVKAAQTGHLLLATLHANDAIETLTRLRNIGINPFNIVTSLRLILAQRLVRRLCNACKVKTSTFFEPRGCHHCIQGYKGQVGIYELLPISTEIESLVMNQGSSIQIKQQFQKEQGLSLRDAGLLKVKQGITSLAEVQRVI